MRAYARSERIKNKVLLAAVALLLIASNACGSEPRPIASSSPPPPEPSTLQGHRDEEHAYPVLQTYRDEEHGYSVTYDGSILVPVPNTSTVVQDLGGFFTARAQPGLTLWRKDVREREADELAVLQTRTDAFASLGYEDYLPKLHGMLGIYTEYFTGEDGSAKVTSQVTEVGDQPAMHFRWSSQTGKNSWLWGDTTMVLTRIGWVCTWVGGAGREAPAAARPLLEAAASMKFFGRSSSVSDSTPRESIGTASPSRDVVSWAEASEHLGEVVTVEGPVLTGFYAEESDGKPTFLNIGRDYPDPSRFRILIWGEDRSSFPDAPENVYAGHTVRVTGLVSRYEGVPEIEVFSPDAIDVVD